MKDINVEPMVHRPAYRDVHVATLSKMLEIAALDKKGDRYGSRARRDLVKSLPAELGAYKIDDFLQNDPTATRYHAAELLLTEEIESTSLLNEEVLRTVLAGAEKFKVIRNIGCAMYQTKSNALRVPIGEAQRNAEVVAEAAEIPDRTQDYSKVDFAIKKYGVKPRISFEMIEDGLVDVVAEEIFYAGASLENKLNVDSIGKMITGGTGTNDTTFAVTGTSATPNNVIKELIQAKKLLKADGYFADTLIACGELENQILSADNVLQAHMFGGNEAMRTGGITNILGMKMFVTDNGVDPAGATWSFDTHGDLGGIALEAKRGIGIAMRRDITIKKFEDITRELQTLTATMRVDQQLLQPAAICHINYYTS